VRLNGWQRIFVVLTTMWSVGVGLLAWQTWPAAVRNYRPWEVDFEALASKRGESLAQFIRGVYPWAYNDLSNAELETAFRARYPPKSQPAVVSYSTALAAELGGTEVLSSSNRKTPEGAPQTVRVVSGVGTVSFPGSMSEEEVETRAKRLSELHENNEAKLRQSNYSRQMAKARSTAALWLVPPALIYALGWAVGWIRRGFVQS